jgi:hypothetical protein
MHLVTSSHLAAAIYKLKEIHSQLQGKPDYKLKQWCCHVMPNMANGLRAWRKAYG